MGRRKVGREVFFCQVCGKPILKRQNYVVPNRATARTPHQLVRSHVRCATAKASRTEAEGLELLRTMIEHATPETRQLLRARGKKARSQGRSPDTVDPRGPKGK